MPTSTYFTGSIEQRLSDDLHLAGVTEHAKCSPDKIDEEQLRQWLLHLKVDKQLGQRGQVLYRAPLTRQRVRPPP